MATAPKRPTSHKSKQYQAEAKQRRSALESEIRNMANLANSRLRALERNDLTAASNAYRYIERRHFDKDSALATDRSGRMKFDTALKNKTHNQLQHEKRELQRFLYEAKTSTVRGTNARYTKAYKTYIEHHKSIHMSKKEFQSILRTAGFRTFVKSYGSKQIVNLLEKVQNARDKDPLYMADLEKALGELTMDTTLDEFYKNAALPLDWQTSEAPKQENPYIPDSSAYGGLTDEEIEEGWISLDEFLALPKRTSGRKSSGGKRRKR